MNITAGMIFAPKDKRRTNRRIKVERITRTKGIRYAMVTARKVGERSWSVAPAIRLDRLTSRAYRLVKS